MSGQRVQIIPVPQLMDRYQLYLNELPPGHYIIHVFNSEHHETERVIKI